MKHFPRPALAQKYADGLQGKLPYSYMQHGLLLTAPRRTGKTAFLLNDLLPELEQRGYAVITVDLWEELNTDPGVLIAQKVLDVLQREQNESLGGKVKGALRKILEASAFGIKIKLDRNNPSATLAKALGTLQDLTGKKIALLIDEAQHALASEAGNSAMHTLKSLRDHGLPGKLFLVMTGSHNDKLSMLVQSQSAPFYGSPVETLPPLPREFVQALAEEIHLAKPQWAPLPIDPLVQVFADIGHMPQKMWRHCEELMQLDPAPADAKAFAETLRQRAAQHQQDERLGMQQRFCALDRLGQAILWRLLDKGDQFRPYDKAALDFYAQHSGQACTIKAVQNKLTELRKLSPPIIWKSFGNDYAIYDQSMQDWFAFASHSWQWPPHCAPQA